MTKHVPPNTNKEPQKRFHSTKNVRKQTNKTVSKPNTNAFKALTVLQKTDITVCAICYREDDPSNETDIT